MNRFRKAWSVMLGAALLLSALPAHAGSLLANALGTGPVYRCNDSGAGSADHPCML